MEVLIFMVKIVNFVYSEFQSAEQRDGRTKNNALGLMPVIVPPFIPTSYSFSIVFSIVGIDFNKSHTFHLDFINQDGESVIAMPGEFPAMPSSEEGLVTRSITISIDLRNLDIKSVGTYKSVIKIDDVIAGEFPIDVFMKEKYESDIVEQ